jgi:hypothetical protein
MIDPEEHAVAEQRRLNAHAAAAAAIDTSALADDRRFASFSTFFESLFLVLQVVRF